MFHTVGNIDIKWPKPHVNISHQSATNTREYTEKTEQIELKQPVTRHINVFPGLGFNIPLS